MNKLICLALIVLVDGLNYKKSIKQSELFFQLQLSEKFPSFKLKNCKYLVFDIGVNDGADTIFFLKRDFCVIGVDANPVFISQVSVKYSQYINDGKLALFAVGLAPNSINKAMTFYLAGPQHVHSSFNREKAACVHPDNQKMHPKCINKKLENITVPIHMCEGLFSIGRPWYVKIDIEEMHYVCVEAISRLSADKQPLYFSWEMHEFALNLKYPVLDASLITSAARSNYPQVKLISQLHNKGSGLASAPLLPEETIDFYSRNTSWHHVEHVMMRGIPDIRQHGSFYDFYMKHVSVLE
eukprot:gene5968-12040_t